MKQEVNFILNTKGGVVYGIDATSANKEQRTGVEQYARHLIQAMKARPLETGERVVLYSPTALDEELGELPQGWESCVVKWPLKRGWMRFGMAWEMLRRMPDVLFVPGQGLPLKTPRKVLTTVHDVAFKRYPQVYESSVRRRVEKFTKRAIAGSTKLIVPSEATKQDLVELYDVSENRLAVIPEAVDAEIFQDYLSEEEAPVLKKYRLGSNIFLVVGRLEKKKNVTTILRAFELFKSRRGLGDPYELVFAGEPGYGFEEMKNYFEHSQAKDSMRMLGYVEDADLAKLMSAATAYVFPTWYEGFGIPNLEAMASGTALITSDIPAHREVVGDAGLLVSPEEPEDWARAMQRIVREDGLKEELIKKGKERVQLYSWKKTAEQTWEVLQTLV